MVLYTHLDLYVIHFILYLCISVLLLYMRPLCLGLYYPTKGDETKMYCCDQVVLPLVGRCSTVIPLVGPCVVSFLIRVHKIIKQGTSHTKTQYYILLCTPFRILNVCIFYSSAKIIASIGLDHFYIITAKLN